MCELGRVVAVTYERQSLPPGVHQPVTPCSKGWSRRCPMATGKRCRCRCAGHNHGTARRPARAEVASAAQDER